MNIDKSNLKKVRKLLDELQNLETVISITNNYDHEAVAKFTSMHNDNNSCPITASIIIPTDIKKNILKIVHNRIAEIKEQLKSM